MKDQRKLKTHELKRKTISEFKTSRKVPVVIVLDNVRSLNNIGSIFRTCDALGVESIYLCGISATPPHAEIYKTALGAEDSVDWKYFNETSQAIEYLKMKGFGIYALEQTTESIDIRNFTPIPNKKYAFVFGNEMKGVSQEVIYSCDNSIEIPQFGTKHSFNVS
ncbi:MAG: RNA methyltransferase, partial [Bacteroidetes bacterium HGW-Bacteroidetes-15]